VTGVGVVVLTMGDRSAALQRLLAGLRSQRGVDLDVVVVGNGCRPDVPAGVRVVELADNVGVPEGRNVGARAVDGPIIAFLDDDLELPSPDVIARVLHLFDVDPRLAVVQPRSVDPVTGVTARRHVPRLDVRRPDRSGDVAWFWEGCSFVRRAAFDEVGGWPGAFFYGHEGIELAWRLVDAGYRIHYAADITVGNPPAAPFRGPEQQFRNARNRVWVARRNLPHPFLETYVAVWAVATLLRVRSRANLTAAVRGFAAGWRTDAGPRRPISWRGVWRLTRAGRPPIV
jgi:GT2 family glycosyltransferase